MRRVQRAPNLRHDAQISQASASRRKANRKRDGPSWKTPEPSVTSSNTIEQAKQLV